MEGILWKWTNYWNGWQTRWFVLEAGVLSYYMSQEEVNQGCKGSMKVSALEIMVNGVDQTRMDLVVPGEKHVYLRANSGQERQRWLVALGSSKACLTTSHHAATESGPDSLKSKRSELRLYCDLLMQQVHTVKTAAADPAHPDLQKLAEGSCLLTATCDSFIKALEDCVSLGETASSPTNHPHPHPHSQHNSGKITNKPTVPLMRTNSYNRKT